ncbi:MAG: TldD/PmbA family protein [Methanomassiliicoccales archaeon]|jgi:PmbA protein|nr:TldD/PmbA family protein [Methanomassiliicoccales archaeon]
MRPEEVASAAIQAAKSAGADQAEAFVVSARSVSAYVDDSRVKSVEEKNDLGVAVRVVVGGRLGQSTTSVSSLRQAQQCARTAVRAATLTPKDKVFKGFAWPAKEQRRFNAKDAQAAAMTVEGAVEKLKDVIGGAFEPRKVKVPNGVLRVADLESVVANTNELLTRRESSLVFVIVSAMTEGAAPGEGTEYFFSPYLKELDPGKVGASAHDKAKASARAKAYKGRTKLPVILPPHELSEMLQGSVHFALSAENVNRKRSPLVGKIGKQVTAKCLDLTDDPLDRRGMLSSPYDDEGTPTKRKVLVKGGVLKGFLYDLYNAQLSGVAPTGNGLRRSTSDAIGNYQMPIGIGPVCLVVRPGTKSVDDLVREMDRGLVVEKTSAPDVHPITGDFGLEVRCAHLVEKGEVRSTVKHCILSGNMFHALGQVGAVADDGTVSRNLVLPSVRFEDLELIGSE